MADENRCADHALDTASMRDMPGCVIARRSAASASYPVSGWPGSIENS
jgi:hypothetical protein